MNSQLPLGSMMDLDRGIISREIFVDPAIYREELEKLFTRAWLMVGHESQIASPGDFFVSRMGEESVILCRDRTSRIHVFLNSCRHRGMKVCRYDSGNTAVFTCPYHAWTYATDGALQGVPQHETLYQGLDREQWRLIEVPRIFNYKGTIWASWDPAAPDFLVHLGEARWHLDQVLDCRDGREGGSEVIGVHKWVFPANWKFAAENFTGDTYHNISHKSVDMIGIGPSAAAGKRGRRDDEMDRAQHVWVNFPPGHGVHSALSPVNAPYSPTFLADARVDEYFRHCHEERQRRLGEKARLIGFTSTWFPNASAHARQPRGLCVWHPHSPTSTEAWRFFLVDKDAPAEVKDVLRRYYMRYSGPAGMTEQDDMENWLYATSASVGTIARRYPFNYQQSMNAARDGDPIPGSVSLQITEENSRNFYRAWSVYLRGGSWDEILGRPGTKRPHARAAE